MRRKIRDTHTICPGGHSCQQSGKRCVSRISVPNFTATDFTRTMLDARLRRLIDPPLDAAGRWLADHGVTADAATITSCGVGLAGAGLIAVGRPLAGLAFILAGRIGDGLDGAVARASVADPATGVNGGPTDRGGYLDIVLDFAVYAAVPLAFAVADPANALAASCLLASFLVNGAAFLAFAVMAERRKISTDTQGRKSLYYLAGLMEGTETIVFFALFCLWPAWFVRLALVMAALCVVSGVTRILVAYRTLGRPA